ncbi:DUF2203 domain-containing protein [Paenibacillus sp. GCM10023252]|uniref:DUF2203 domain-containing protein n=1 Tax=Paenibacillus sp. GCM10023252 TaxID=3252649 RepID=UPI003617BB15
MESRLFTVSEANAMLPALREELGKLQALVSDIEDKYTELKRAKREQHSEPSVAVDLFFEEEGVIEFMKMEADLMLGNFHRQGVLVKSISPGLLDFPGLLGEESILLCWKEGEERITHYHGWHDGFIGRKPLAE